MGWRTLAALHAHVPRVHRTDRDGSIRLEVEGGALRVELELRGGRLLSSLRLADAVPDAPWLGWSLGGLVALHAAQARPTRVPALLMLCASPRFVRGDDWPFGVSAEIFRDFAAGLRQDYQGTLERFIALEAFGSDHAREEIRALRADVLARGAPDAAALADGLELLERTDLRATLPALQVPSLWLAGRRDRLVDPRAMQAAATIAPGATANVIEHAGHAPFLTHADAVASQVRTFLGQRPVAAARPA